MKQIAKEMAPVAPPVAVSGMTLFGYPLPELALVLTILYTAVMLIVATPKAYRTLRNGWRTAKGQDPII